MSTVACQAPSPWAAVPTRQVVRLAGLTPEELAVALDPLPADAPVVVRYRMPTAASSVTVIVDDVLDRLEAVARELFPAWLPDAHLVDTASYLDRRVVRQLARRRASATEHFGPFLADVAEAALLGRPIRNRFPPETRALGLARILSEAYHRDGVALLIEAAELGGHQHRYATACEWLANHGGLGIWLIGDILPSIDRFATFTLPVPATLKSLALDTTELHVIPPVEYPPLSGKPHPASQAEQTLERCLAQCDWAVGRVWNQVHLASPVQPLAPLIRVDLMWPDERCAVEIDGPDHRGSLKYADDRRRDNALVLDGFAVLRFTNDEISDDPQRAIAVIEALLTTKRRNEGAVE